MRRVHQTAVCTLVMASVTGGRADLPQSQKQLLADIYYATGGDVSYLLKLSTENDAVR